MQMIYNIHEIKNKYKASKIRNVIKLLRKMKAFQRFARDANYLTNH